MPLPRRLISLSSNLDRVIRFDYDDDEDKKKPGTLGSAARAGVVAGGVGAGLYGVGSMSKSPGGLGYTGRQTITNAGSDLSKLGKGGLKNITSTIGRGYNVSADAAKAAAPKVTGAIAGLYQKLRGLSHLSAHLDRVIAFDGKPIEKLNPKNKGALTKTEEETGKSAEELKHSKNPKTRKRATFAVNAKKFKHRRKSRAAALSSTLDSIIEFAQAPATDSWNPITRHRQNKALKTWVANRPASAGVTSEQLEKKYPGTGRGKRLAGAGLGAIAGGLGGSLLHSKLAGGEGKIAGLLGAALGAGVGEAAVGPQHAIDNWRANKKDFRTLRDTFKNDSVSADQIKATVPIATSHRQVTKELKKQGVGFFKRQALGLATFPARHTHNAAFVPAGDTGVIVSGKKVPRIVAAHESGHAKDYAHFGGEKGFRLAYRHYGNPFVGRKTYIQNTLLPEERAWSYARPKSRKDKAARDAALGTYARGGFFNSMLDDLLQFKAIDLGYTYGDGGPSICSDEYNQKKHFPSLYVSDLQKDIDLPLSGEAKVKFKLRSKTARQDEAGNKKHSADIEIHSIDVIDPSTTKPKEGGRAKLIGLTAEGEVVEFGRAGRYGAALAALSLLGHGGAVKAGDAADEILAARRATLQASGKLQKDVIAERPRGVAAGATSSTAAAQPAQAGKTVVAKDTAAESRDAKAAQAEAESKKIIDDSNKRKIGESEKDWSARKAKAKFDAMDQKYFSIRGVGEVLGNHLPNAALVASAHRGKIGLGAGFLLGRKLRKKKTDQGSIPGDYPGSTSELSAKLDLILLGDPRSRNKLGEFSGNQESTVDPNAVNVVYASGKRKGLHQGIVEGAAAGIGGGAGATAVKTLFDKLKKVKK